jgi:NADH-quinone oxidoreductase subunit N
MGRAWFADQGSSKSLLAVGTALMLIGLGFKASFVPFHQWTPDVYQGAPTNVTAFMAAASKVGAFAALWRVLEATPFLKVAWMPALGVIAVLTMVVGNVMALVQKDVKRVLAYSSISHAGYVLVAILAHFRMPDRIPFSTVGYYLLVYTLMTVGAFAVIGLGAKPKGEAVTLADLRGLRNRAPLAAAALIVFMLSLAGVPPMSGFFGKLMIFNDAMRAHLQPLAIALAINSIVSAYYYLQIAKAAYVDEPETEAAPIGKGLLAGVSSTSVVCVAGIVLATFLVSPVLEFFGGNREVATPVRAPSQSGP